MNQPTIPGRLMRSLTELRAGEPEYRADMGGQYLPGKAECISFQGAVLPLSEMDLRRMPQGTYTADTRKVYTNGHVLAVGARVEDEMGQAYVVTGALDYGILSPMKRYIVERKGAIQ